MDTRRERILSPILVDIVDTVLMFGVDERNIASRSQLLSLIYEIIFFFLQTELMNFFIREPACFDQMKKFLEMSEKFTLAVCWYRISLKMFC